MTHSRRTIVIGISLLTILLAQASFAGEPYLGDPEQATQCASGKLWRGFVNTFTGLGEIIRQPIVCTMDNGPVGVPVGLINGVIMSFVRTGTGILEVITFPVPFDEEIGYDSILDPAYVWQRAK